MNIDYSALNSHLAEYNELSNKQHHVKADERRMAYLQTAISALKAGASFEDVLDSARRSDAKQFGITLDKAPTAREIEARGWQSFVEKRDMVEGNPVSRIGTYSGLGYFSPTEFFPTVFSAMSAHDVLFVESPKCAWLMTRKTLVTVSSIINKFGDQLNLVLWVDGEPFIFGVPVRICPNMDQIGASNVPVVLGDLSYWCTRLVIDEKSGVQVYTEADSLIEYGKVGMSCFMRADGELLYKDTSSPAPFTYIRNHS